MAWILFAWCKSHQVELSAKHIHNQNVLEDAIFLTHLILPEERPLKVSVFQKLASIWFQPEVDLFSTRWNHKLPRFISLAPDPLAWDRDALSFSWQGGSWYAYPPLRGHTEVLLKFQQQPAQLMLVAPCRPRAVWFPLAVELSSDVPQLLSFSGDLLQQPHNIAFYQGTDLRLLAWCMNYKQTPSPQTNRWKGILTHHSVPLYSNRLCDQELFSHKLIL